MYYNGARYYDPELGRFSTVDPQADANLAVSPYVYALDNPMKYIDLEGTENKYALDWARSNMAGKAFRFEVWYKRGVGGWVFQPTVVPSQMVCYESCFIAYMNSGEAIRNPC